MVAKKTDLDVQTEEFLNSPKEKNYNTPEEIAAQEALNSSVTLDLASKADSGSTNFLPLEEDFYKMTVEKSEVRERPNYTDPSVMEKVIMITFSIDGTVSGTPVKDINGVEQKPGERKFWEFLSTTALGFTGGGQPSKTRACICALNKVDATKELKGIKIEELIGKSCKVMMSIKDKKDGEKKNYAAKYSIL